VRVYEDPVGIRWPRTTLRRFLVEQLLLLEHNVGVEVFELPQTSPDLLDQMEVKETWSIVHMLAIVVVEKSEGVLEHWAASGSA
jgi:hypothetical protein